MQNIDNSNKRKNETEDDDMNKVLRLSNPINTFASNIPSFPYGHNFSYVSPSNLYHFTRGDPFHDVSNRFTLFFKNMFPDITLQKDITASQIMNQGTLFEKKVKDLLASKYNLIELPSPYQGINDAVIYNKTIEAMKSGIDIIYQGYFFNKDMEIHGHPDFLIRSDLVNKVCLNNNYPDEYLNMPSRFGDFHYVVFDTKFHTLDMNVSMERMINNPSEKYYKTQLYMYSKCLEYIQGVSPAFAYVIGRGFRMTKTRNNIRQTQKSNNIFEHFGPINILDIESETQSKDISIPGLVNEGIDWIKTLRTINTTILNDVNWENPDKIYFRPNMQNEYTTNRQMEDMSPIRRKLAIMQGEPTLFRSIGHKERQILHKNNVFSLNDPNCTSELIGIKDELTRDNMTIRIQQFRDKDNIMPSIYGRYISNNKLKNKTMGNRDLLRYFKFNGYIVMDFETRVNISDKFDNLPMSDDNTCAYLIGLINVDSSGKSEYNPIIASRLDNDNEFKLFKNLIDYMTPHVSRVNPKKILIWSHAEITFIKKLFESYESMLTESEISVITMILDNIVDMYRFFEQEKIIIKDCYTLSLKDVAKGLHKLGHISTIWKQETPGLGILNQIDTINDEVIINDTTIDSHPMFDEILTYNFVDCQVIVEIVNWLYTRTMFYSNKQPNVILNKY